jgi:predicted SnoaL-like aldol condensation-catalyzing enzyme
MSDSNPTALFNYLTEQLNRFGLAYFHIIEPRIKGNVLIGEGQPPVATAQLRKIFKGKIIAAGGFEPDTAEAIVEQGDADLVAFGRYFIANPDLPKRIKLGLPLNAYDRATFYTFDFHGYTDYPFYDQQRDGLLSDPFCSQFHDSPFYFDSCLHAGFARASAITSPRSELKNKALVLDEVDTLFNKRDYVAAARYWSPSYIQHSAHIEPGRDGLFNLVKSIPSTLKYEPGVIVAEGDLVIVHGRFSGFGAPVNWVAADILRQGDILMLHGRFSGIGQPANWIVVDIVRLETAGSPNTGTSSRTRLRAQRRSAACRCSLWDNRLSPHLPARQILEHSNRHLVACPDAKHSGPSVGR